MFTTNVLFGLKKILIFESEACISESMKNVKIRKKTLKMNMKC